MHLTGSIGNRCRSRGVSRPLSTGIAAPLPAGELQIIARLMQFPRVVVAAGDLEGAVIEELGEHVEGDPGVGVALGVAYLYLILRIPC
jgi:hypothetical protein